MSNTKRFKQWKSFDFGPSQNVCSSTKDPPKENLNNRVINKKSANVAPKKSFNFHEKLSPICISDLAVHPKKIQEVEEWFKFNVCQSISITSPFLILSGPTGSGKTATVNVICKSFNISVSEWVNPIDQEYEYRGMNQIDQFVEFLSDSKYGCLFESSTNRITVVKDFPNAVINNPDQFFEILECCKYKTRQAIIFICTEASSMSLNLQRTLFPDDIIRKFDITHISFNACAASLMKIAFRRAQELVKSNCDIFKQPSAKTIEAILASADGDIRNAMNQFHMASLIGSGDLPTEKIESTQNTKRKRSSKELKLSVMTKDHNLGLFHGLGRVLNPKRKQVGTSWRLTHNIETLVDEFSTHPHMFTSFLFENYLKYFGDLSEVAKSAEILSLSVKFLETWTDRHETLVFALWVSVLGLMIYNGHRVSKWNQIRGPVKIQSNKIAQEWDNIGLKPTDYFYYNIINRSDKFHRYKFDF